MKRKAFWGMVILALAAGAVVALRPRPVLVAYGRPVRMTVREYIAEDAETQLARTYTVDMPVSGTVSRIEWEVGDIVQQGEALTRVESLPIEQQIKGLEALVAQTRAQITGVDVSKPKPEALAAAEERVKEATALLEMARKARAIVEINLEQARKDYDRAQRLRAEGVMSQRSNDEAESAFRALEQDLARARLAEQAAGKGLEIATLASRQLADSVDDNEFMREAHQAHIANFEAQLEILRDDLEKTTIRAPVTGPILMKFVENRRTLLAGTPLLQMGDPASSEILCDVLSEEVVRVAPGDAVEITGKALDGETALGTVKRIHPAAFKKISALGIEQQRVRVLIDYDTQAVTLRPGTSLDVKIITAESADTLAVPDRAVFQHEGAWHVFKTDGGTAWLTPVTVGLKNEDWAEVTAGLGPEDTFVAEPPNDLADGARVKEKDPS